jgi:hypothetical protein
MIRHLVSLVLQQLQQAVHQQHLHAACCFCGSLCNHTNAQL